MERKTALIVAANQPVGEHLAIQLAAHDWQVVVIGSDELRLLELAKRNPERIDPLHMSLDSRSNAERLGQVWGDQRVDLLAQFQPIALPQQITLAVRSVMLMTDAFAQGLKAASGLNIVAMPRSRDVRDPLSQAAEGAHARAVRAISLRHEDSGFRTVGLLATRVRGQVMADAAVALATGLQSAGNGAVRGL